MPENGPCWAAFPCTLGWSSFQARKMQSLTHSEFSLPGSVWVCKSVSRFAKKTSRWNVQRGASNRCQVGARLSTTGGSQGDGELCPRGAARRLCVLFITCWTRALQEGWGFLKPSVSVLFSGMQRKSNHLPEGGSLFRTAASPLGSHKGKTVIGVHRAGAASLLALCTSLFEQAFQIDPAHFG